MMSGWCWPMRSNSERPLPLITLEAPEAFFLACTALSLPYNILAIVGVWRAANHYPGPDLHADLARGVSLTLLGLLSLL